MKDTDQRTENGGQAGSEGRKTVAAAGRSRVYRSENGGERRIGRLAQNDDSEIRPGSRNRSIDSSIYRGTQSSTEAKSARRSSESNAQVQTACYAALRPESDTGSHSTDEAEVLSRPPRRRSDESIRMQSAARAEAAADELLDSERKPFGWKDRMVQRRRKRIRITLGIFGGLFAAIYIAVAIYFGFHFYENTFIYGIDCSQLTVEEVKAEVAEKLDDYVLTIEERGNVTETISAAEIGLEFVDNSSIDKMLRAQHCYIWPVMMLLERKSVVSVAFSYDEAKVEETLNTLDCYDILREIPPRDAYITTTETGFEVVQEIMGTTLNRTKTLETVLEALNAGAQNVSLDENDCYVNPEIYQDNEELVSDAAAMSELAQANFTYDFGPNQEVVNAQLIQNWIVELSDGTFVIDDVLVTEYVEELAAKYDTFGLPIEFYTSLGTTETLSGGDYGWCIDQSETVVELLKALESGYQGNMEPVYLYSAMSHENNGIGYTYVEICISQQRMWCYENGTCIVDTPVVTGNPNKDNGTPSGGVWAIDAKKRDAILEGEGYAEPVDYWMPFNDDVGIHDFKERAYFGGTIYLTNGSHGCVNTPYEAVQTIYEAVSIGTPVIVYE